MAVEELNRGRASARGSSQASILAARVFALCLVLTAAGGAAAAQTGVASFSDLDAPEVPAVPVAKAEGGAEGAGAKVRRRRVGGGAEGLGLLKRTALVRDGSSGGYAYGVSGASGATLGGVSTGDAAVDRFILDSSGRHGVDPLLIYSMMYRESSFKRFATSNKGARGYMQLMPATAARLGVRDIYDPRQNIDGGVRYVRLLLDMFDGDLSLTLAGYNAGEGSVLKYGRSVPPYAETREYVNKIGSMYLSLRGAGRAAPARGASPAPPETQKRPSPSGEQ